MRAANRVAVGLGLVLVAALSGGCSLQNTSEPLCPAEGEDRNLTALLVMAQSVPSAAFVPCITDFPPGWSFGGERLRNGHSQFWLSSDRAGMHAVSVTLTQSCDTSRAVQVPPEPNEPASIRRFEEPRSLPPAFSGSRFYVFPGGCVTYEFSFSDQATFAQTVEATESLSFVARALGVTELAKDGLLLCGRGAPPCAG